jgi:competence protein ComEC
MASSELIILDVGHGNCALIKHGSEAIIIDAPAKPIVARALDELGITSIHSLIISHADNDHLSGAIPLMMNDDRPIQHVYVNPDDRDSAAWHDFRTAVGTVRRSKRGITVHTSLNMEEPQELKINETTLTVLHPSPELCLATTAGVHTDGRRVNANYMSAVVLVEHDGERICLLAADSDKYSLDLMLEEKTNLRAPVLIFPHHGGRAGQNTDNREFAKQLVSAVQPSLVLFSLGRGSHGTPRAEIVLGVREAMAGTVPYIACTQLSRNCCNDSPPSKSPQRLLDKNSDGYAKDNCCAGTISIPLEKKGWETVISSLTMNHGSFVAKEVPGSLCRRKIEPFSESSRVIAKV